MNHKYQSRLGMLEMELAAETCIAKYNNNKNSGISIKDMDSDMEKIGFVELVYRGWLKKEKYCYNGTFNITKELKERLVLNE